jgi:hypothetical protein
MGQDVGFGEEPVAARTATSMSVVSGNSSTSTTLAAAAPATRSATRATKTPKAGERGRIALLRVAGFEDVPRTG